MDYGHYQDFLEQAGSPAGAADVHGALCGVLSGGGNALTELWLQDTLADCEPGDTEQAILRDGLVQLGRDTWQVLSGAGLEFVPLLPDDDDVNLVARTEALACWCQGFLFGLARVGLVEAQLKHGVIGEVLPDLVEISKASAAVDQDLAEAGFALEELVEYVRVTAQLVFEELAPTRQALLQRH